MRKLILILSLVAVASVILFIATRAHRTKLEVPAQRPNLTAPERYIVDVGGKQYSLSLSRYDPPYEIHQRLIGRADADCSTPEGAEEAAWAAQGRDKEWYLSLFDAKAQEELLKLDKETGGQVLNEDKKAKPPSTDWLRNNYTRLIYKISFSVDGKEYVVIREQRVHDGQQIAPTYVEWVKDGSSWKQPWLNDRSPIHELVVRLTEKEYREVSAILNAGTWEFWP